MNPLAFRRSLQEAWGYTAEVSEYRKSSHAVYRLRYHFVFITKYRKPALRGEIGKEVRDLTREICRSLDIEIVKGHVRPDHVHLLLDVPPRLAPSRVMQAIKGKTSHHLLQDHRKLHKEFWGRHLWARSTLVPKDGSLSSQPASEARSLGDFSRMSNPPPSGGGEWDPSQELPVMVQRGDPTQGDPERSLADRRCGSWRHESPTHTADSGCRRI